MKVLVRRGEGPSDPGQGGEGQSKRANVCGVVGRSVEEDAEEMALGGQWPNNNPMRSWD
jgi:hypothetical protein